jgi:hypothetical protein
VFFLFMNSGMAVEGGGRSVKPARIKRFKGPISFSILFARIGNWLGGWAVLLAMAGLAPQTGVFVHADPLAEPVNIAPAKPAEETSMRLVQIDPQGRVELDLRLSDEQLDAALLLMSQENPTLTATTPEKGSTRLFRLARPHQVRMIRSAPALLEAAPKQVIRIDQEGMIQCNNQPISDPDQLDAILRKAARDTPGFAMQLRFDARAEWDGILDVLRICFRHGIRIAEVGQVIEGTYYFKNGFSTKIVELQQGTFRYWFSSDVVRPGRQVAYPLSGRYYAEGGKIILLHPYIFQKELTFRTLNETPSLWRPSAIDYWRREKKLARFGVLFPAKDDPEAIWGKTAASSGEIFSIRLISDDEREPGEWFSAPGDDPRKLRVLNEKLLDETAVTGIFHRFLGRFVKEGIEMDIWWTSDGAQQFREIVEKHAGSQIAILFQKEIVFAPRLEPALNRPFITIPLKPQSADSLSEWRKWLALLAYWRGRVLHDNGNAAEGATVSLAWPGFPLHIKDGAIAPSDERFTAAAKFRSQLTEIPRSDSEGWFNLIGQHGAFGNVIVLHERGFAWVPVEALMASPIVQLAPWGAIEGTALAEGKPIVNASIRLKPAEQEHGFNHSVQFEERVVTDAEGRFAFSRVAPVTMELHFESPDGIAGSELQRIKVLPGKVISIILELPPNRTK